MASQKQARATRSRTSPVRATPTAPPGARAAGAAKPGTPKSGAVRPAPAKPAAADPPAAEDGARRQGGWRGFVGWMTGSKLEFSTLLVSLAGLGVAIYMTIGHYTTNTYLGCSATGGAVSCEKVTTSPEAYVFHIPVAILGLAFFAFMLVINTPWAWRAKLPALHWARLISVIVGIAFVLWLVYAELFLIGSICLYCTSVHVLTFALFTLVIARVAISGLRPREAIR